MKPEPRAEPRRNVRRGRGGGGLEFYALKCIYAPFMGQGFYSWERKCRPTSVPTFLCPYSTILVTYPKHIIVDWLLVELISADYIVDSIIYSMNKSDNNINRRLPAKCRIWIYTNWKTYTTEQRYWEDLREWNRAFIDLLRTFFDIADHPPPFLSLAWLA